MDATSSDAVFGSFNFTPRLFLNEVLNIVDDMVDAALDFFHRDASKLLKIEEGTDRADELSKGVEHILDLVQGTLGERMEKWEEYALRFSFSVPEGFSMPKDNEPSGDVLPDLDSLTDSEIDAQLSSLREKLVLVGKESVELGKELQVLERQSLTSNQSTELINEALQLYEKTDAPKLFKELTNVASEFRVKLGTLKRRRMEESHIEEADMLHFSQENALRMPQGLLGAKLEELQEFLDEIMTT